MTGVLGELPATRATCHLVFREGVKNRDASRQRTARGWSVVRVADLMSAQVKTLREDASVGRAYAEMVAGFIRHFPVLNRNGELTGVISNVDVARAFGHDGRGRAVPVEEIMSHHVVAVPPQLPAWRAARMMRQKKISSLMVVSPNGKLAGIITASDFLAVAEQLLRAPQPRRTRTR